MDRMVANIRNTKKGIRCDRTSALGNPFYMKTEAERDSVCGAYQAYFDLVVEQKMEPCLAAPKILKTWPLTVSRGWFAPTRTAFTQALEFVKQKPNEPLLCWCAPKRCHCRTIAEWVGENLASSEN
jgi:Domain of unknown function (DUF4326)